MQTVLGPIPEAVESLNAGSFLDCIVCEIVCFEPSRMDGREDRCSVAKDVVITVLLKISKQVANSNLTILITGLLIKSL